MVVMSLIYFYFSIIAKSYFCHAVGSRMHLCVEILKTLTVIAARTHTAAFDGRKWVMNTWNILIIDFWFCVHCVFPLVLSSTHFAYFFSNGSQPSDTQPTTVCSQKKNRLRWISNEVARTRRIWLYILILMMTMKPNVHTKLIPYTYLRCVLQ